MNYLAHFYLSGENENILLGNYIGDSVKGKDYLKYPAEIAKGILLHREIDTFTDKNEIFRITTSRLQPRYKKYAGVITDVFYDHFLAKNWEKFSAVSLSNFSKNIYFLLDQNKNLLPAKSSLFLSYMIRYNILSNYSKKEGIKRVLEGLSGRTKFDSKMEYATEELEIYYKETEVEFLSFFPEIISHLNNYNNK